MRILVLNPNTCAEMTELVMRVLAPMTPAGLAARVEPDVGVPVICSTQAGFAAVLDAARDPPPKPAQGDLALPAAIPSTGL